jgi:hypothetical protein
VEHVGGDPAHPVAGLLEQRRVGQGLLDPLHAGRPLPAEMRVVGGLQAQQRAPAVALGRLLVTHLGQALARPLVQIGLTQRDPDQLSLERLVRVTVLLRRLADGSFEHLHGPRRLAGHEQAAPELQRDRGPLVGVAEPGERVAEMWDGAGRIAREQAHGSEPGAQPRPVVGRRRLGEGTGEVGDGALRRAARQRARCRRAQHARDVAASGGRRS